MAVARALGITVNAGAGSAETLNDLGGSLGQRPPILLVLDNGEQATGPVATAIAAWIAQVPNAFFLVTSREVLKLHGERVLEIGPLGLPHDGSDPGTSEAVRLFVDRATESERATCSAWSVNTRPTTIEDRSHMSLDRDAPVSRGVEPPTAGRVVALPRVGGLHHRYSRAA